jgi:hypothetical protein
MKYDETLMVHSFSLLNNFQLRKYALHNKLIKKNKINTYTKYKIMKRIFKLHNDSSIKIQKIYRYSSNKPYKRQLQNCINTETLYGDNLYDINVCFIYYYKQFAFDIRELKMLITGTCVNPYTQIKFSPLECNKINKRYNDLLRCGINLKINNEIPSISKYTTKFAQLLTRFSDLSVYPNATLFSKYSNTQLLYYIKYIRTFQSIKLIFTDDIYTKIRKLYNLHKFDDFKYEIISIMYNILCTRDNMIYNRALILTESILQDIIEIYNDIVYEYNSNIISIDNNIN